MKKILYIYPFYLYLACCILYSGNVYAHSSTKHSIKNGSISSITVHSDRETKDAENQLRDISGVRIVKKVQTNDRGNTVTTIEVYNSSGNDVTIIT